MKNYRKTVALMATAILSMSLVACSNDSGAGGGSSSGEKDSSNANGQVVTLATTASDKLATENVVAAFTKKTGIKVELTVADTDNYQTTLRTQLSSGTAPDVFFTWPGEGNPMTMTVLQKAGLLKDLSDMSFAKDIPEGLKAVSQIDGATYIAPLNISVIGGIYSQTALDEAGLKVPSTWTELLSFCSAAKDQGKTAFSLAAATPWNTQLIPYALVSTLVYSVEPDFEKQLAAGTTTFADSGWVDALNKNLEMAEAGCFQENYLGTTYEEALSQVAQGNAFASVQVNSSLAAITDAAPEGTEFVIEPIPATDNATATFIPAAAGGSYGINASAKNPDAATQLLEFMTSTEGVAIYATDTAGIPALDAGDMKTNPALVPMQKLIDEGRTYSFMDQLWPNAKVQQTHFEVIQQLLAGTISSKEGLKQMDAAYQEG